MTPAVEVQGVKKSFGDHVAVQDLSFSVPQGTIYGFLGPNGAGKTTTLRMLIGIYHPDSGSVHVLGQRNPQSVREQIGYLPEERGIYDKMKLLDVLRYFGQLKGMSAAAANARATELLQRFGLGEWQQHKCQDLSKGMTQKAQILATIMHDPQLLILDEPFAGLDPLNRDLMRDAILQMRREGRTVLFSTHIMEQAEQLCDRVLLIDRGRKVLDGTQAEIKAGRGQAIQLDYEGAGRLVASLPGVRRVNDSGHRAELLLDADADSQAILKGVLAQGLHIRGFTTSEPSLHEIFIQHVGHAEPLPVAGEAGA